MMVRRNNILFYGSETWTLRKREEKTGRIWNFGYTGSWRTLNRQSENEKLIENVMRTEN